MHPCLKHPIFDIVSQVAYETGQRVYVIGGYVRDALLQRHSKDIDILVIGNGIEFAKKVAKTLSDHTGKKVPFTAYGRFHTAMLKYKNEEIEFVGARKESYSPDSRNPMVEDGTLDDDQKRRDFTINALAFDLTIEHFGELVDPFDGLKDLDDEIIRTPLDPDITFSDDPLRMLRAIRFASQLNFSICSETFNAIAKNKDRIHIISAERINEELNKILLSPLPSIGFRLLEESGLLEIIFPEIHNLKFSETINGKHHKDNFMHSLKVLDNVSMRGGDLWLRWAALLHDVGKPIVKKFNPKIGWTFHGHDAVGQKMVPHIFKKMRMPLNDKMKYVQKLVGLHMRPIVLAQEIVTDSAVRRLLFDAGEDIEDLMKLCEADITSRIEENIKRYMTNFKIVRQKLREIEEKDAIRNFQPPIDGNEIIELFHLTPGPIVGVLKNAVKDAILDGAIGNNREEAMVFLEAKVKELDV